MRKTAIALIIIPLLCMVGIFLDGQLRLGAMINTMLPCTQNPLNSFPCYGVYELWIAGILAILFIVGIILGLVLLIKKIGHQLLTSRS